MKDTHYKLIFYCLLTIASLCDYPALYGAARRDSVVKADSARIWFHQSRWNLDTAYRDNGLHLDRMLSHLLRNADSDSALRISAIKVVGAASPEGSVGINERLSRQRADRIFEYFSSRTDLPDSLTHFDFIGRDWAGLQQLAEQDPAMPMRVEAMTLIADIRSDIASAGHDSERNLQRLKTLGGGRPYAYMYRHIFPQLRSSQLLVEYTYRYPERMRLHAMAAPTLNTQAHPQGELLLIDELFLTDHAFCHPFYMGLKTNLLYDALALPSIGAEFYVGKGWSIAANWTYGWWDRDPSHRYWRAYGGDLALRKWLGKAAKEKPLTGHHLGVYAGVVTYDFEFGGKGYMGGLPGKTLWDRCNYMAGIEYGYSLPIARRLNIDFTLGIGWLGGKQIEYVPEDGAYVWQKTRNFNWLGPTKAEVSLVWLIGCDNWNRKFARGRHSEKGGER